MCDECYDDSYVNYPGAISPPYVHPTLLGETREYWDKVEKIAETYLGLGTSPREDESLFEYLIKNPDRPTIPSRAAGLIEVTVITGFAGYYALRDGFRTISKKLHGVCLHPWDIICAQEALYGKNER
ncbi:MAG: hypothetical protein F4X57_12950 [Chloroflexi bacterium]|nr:hypothetical protein [Chloroflexota bacterium]